MSNVYIKRRNLIHRWYYNYMSSQSCSICGCDNTKLLEWHHIKDKHMNVSSMVSKLYAIDTIKDEIDKCIVLCKSCHRGVHSGDLTINMRLKSFPLQTIDFFLNKLRKLRGFLIEHRRQKYKTPACSVV